MPMYVNQTVEKEDLYTLISNRGVYWPFEILRSVIVEER